MELNVLLKKIKSIIAIFNDNFSLQHLKNKNNFRKFKIKITVRFIKLKF